VRVLIVEDERALREQIQARLQRAGYTVQSAAEGTEGLYLALEFPFDVAIVDLGLPGLSGMELIRRLRHSGKALPVLILTVQGRWENKVEGLGAGADDYVVKPFHMEELVARLNALVRRSGGWAGPVLRCPPVLLDTVSHEVTVDGSAVSLTAYEYRLLEYLMLHAGQVVSKTDIVEHLYPDDEDRDSNVIEVFVGRLRRKLDRDDTLNPIETLRGQGYRFALPRGGA
jgi:two-component system, OmpR family, response regulator PhoP